MEKKKEPKIKIFASHHKPGYIYKDDVFVPIQVGKKNAKVDLGILGDDTGDNISEKNPNYAELTAQYWVWKNYDLSDVDYVGFCSYRRYMTYCLKPNFFSYFFKKNPFSGTEKEASFRKLRALNEGYYITNFNHSILNKNTSNIKSFINKNNYDIYFPKREIFYKGKLLSIFNINSGTNTFWTTPLDSGLRGLQEESLSIFFNMYLDCAKSLFKILDEGKNNLYLTHRHMFIMKKELFLKYAKWLFDYLFKLELYINKNKIDTYNYFKDNRFIGIFSEILINYRRLSEEKLTTSFDSKILVLE